MQLEMAQIVRLAADPAPGEPVKVWLLRAARACGVSASYAKRLLYREVRCVPAHVADELRERRGRLLEQRLRRVEAEAAAIRGRLGRDGPGAG